MFTETGAPLTQTIFRQLLLGSNHPTTLASKQWLEPPILALSRLYWDVKISANICIRAGEFVAPPDEPKRASSQQIAANNRYAACAHEQSYKPPEKNHLTCWTGLSDQRNNSTALPILLP